MNLEQLHQAGVRTFAELVPDGERRLAEIFRVAPDLERLAVGTVYGHLHHRTALDPRTREAVTLAAIVASGITGTPLTVHVRAGLSAGLAPAEIVEIVLHTAAYSGFPRAVAALPVLEQVFEDAAVPIPPRGSPRETALELIEKLPQTELADRLGATADTPTGGLPPDVRAAAYTLDADHALAVITSPDVPDEPPAVFYVRCQGERIVQTHWLTEQSGK